MRNISEHFKRASSSKSKGLDHSEVSSSDIDQSMADESFTRFMKDMVDQYVDNKKSRKKYEQTVLSARERAAKDRLGHYFRYVINPSH